MQAIFIQHNHSGYFYLEAMELPFNYKGLPWLSLHERILWMTMYCKRCLVSGWMHRVGPMLVIQKEKHLPSNLFPVTPEQVSYALFCMLESISICICNTFYYTITCENHSRAMMHTCSPWKPYNNIILRDLKGYSEILWSEVHVHQYILMFLHIQRKTLQY